MKLNDVMLPTGFSTNNNNNNMTFKETSSNLEKTEGKKGSEEGK